MTTKQTQPKKHFSIFAKIRGYFLAGFLVAAPIFITLYLTWVFLKFVDTQVSSLIPAAYYPETAVPGMGLLVAVSFFVLLGWVTRNFLGRVVVRLSEYVLDHVPVIRTLYGAIKQVFETMIGAQSNAFREVVMFQYPRNGTWALGFVTGTTTGEIQGVTDDDLVNVYMPTALNIASGFLLFVPRRDLVVLNIGVEEALKLIVSGGIIVPNGENAGGTRDIRR